MDSLFQLVDSVSLFINEETQHTYKVASVSGFYFADQAREITLLVALNDLRRFI